MATYMLTAFNDKGEVLLNEPINATSDSDAKSKGEQMLAEQDMSEKTYRLASPLAQLILFNS